MKRPLIFLFLFLAGCSTAPVADLMDYFSPGRIAPETTPPYGGVAAPQPGSPSLPPGAVAGPSLPPMPPIPPSPAATSPTGAALAAPVTPPTPDSFGPPR